MQKQDLEKFLYYMLDKVEECYKKEVENAVKEFLRETAPEVPVQEQSEFVPEDSNGICENLNPCGSIDAEPQTLQQYCSQVTDIKKIVDELLNVLVANKVPIRSLDIVLKNLKSEVYSNTIIQNNN